jgi:hypothetical protein
MKIDLQKPSELFYHVISPDKTLVWFDSTKSFHLTSIPLMQLKNINTNIQNENKFFKWRNYEKGKHLVFSLEFY